MKKIKVFLQTPLNTSDSLYYKNLIKYPPKSIEYKTNISSSGVITNHKKLMFKTHVKNFIRRLIDRFNLPILNSVKTRHRKIDLIHCAHCLSRNKDFPWVADFEATWQFWISGRNTALGKKAFEKTCARSNCKKILAWTEEAKKEMKTLFPKLSNKLEVLEYAMPYIKSKKMKQNKITLLFSARYFYQKGGLHALEAMDRLTKKYEQVYGIFISEVPEEIKSKYSDNTKIQFLGLISQDKLFEEIYPVSTIFIYPGYSDTFGFGFIEAMNFGLPIVTVDGYARKEIVGKRVGFVIQKKEKINPYIIGKKEEEIIYQLVEKTSELIKNQNLREKMSKNGINEIKNGKFSIKKRNQKLTKIYSSSLE